jgi:HSP20 family molecular chaperone IbpA
MFKKKCNKCNSKIENKFDFCPYCGANFKQEINSEDYGILGKNDYIEEEIFPMMNTSMMDKIMENAFKMAEKMIEKQMRVMSNEQEKFRQPPQNQPNPNNRQPSNLDIQFFVNGERVFPQKVEEKPKPMRLKNNMDMNNETIERLTKLPKKEPVSKVRRLSGKIVYELEVPGVKTLNDIFINQLENSIEIKALSTDKVYSKTLNINLPILGYRLLKGNLILELQENKFN